jgi:hypothetical protein
MTSSETGLHSGKGTLGFEMVSDLFINLESMASRREMLIEMFDYHGFISGDRVT